MEARQIVEQLGDPINAFISRHEVIEVDHKNVAWYTLETKWSKHLYPTKKKQRFRYIQEALLRVRDAKERLKLPVQLPMLPLSIIRGTSEVIRAQRASEFNAFLAAAISVPQLRVMPPLVLLLAPDDVGSIIEPAHQSPPARSHASTSHAPHPLQPRASDAIQTLAHLGHSDMDSANWVSPDRAPISPSPDAAAQPDARGTPSAFPPKPMRPFPAAGPSHASEQTIEGQQRHAGDGSPPAAHSTAQGFNLMQMGSRLPIHGIPSASVASSSKLARMLASLERCKAAANSLAEEVATRDATILQQQEHINRLEEDLQLLRARAL